MSEIYMDTQMMSCMFSEESVQDMWEEGDPRTDELEKLRQLATKLPEKYLTVYDLIYSRQLSQGIVAEMLDVSQSTVCYYVERIELYLVWLLNMPEITDEEFEENISRITGIEDKYTVKYQQMFRLYCQHYSNSEVAKIMKYGRETVQRRILNITRSGIFTDNFITLLDYIKKRPPLLNV